MASLEESQPGESMRSEETCEGTSVGMTDIYNYNFFEAKENFQKFKQWFDEKHGKINIRHLYVGEVCSSRDGLEKGGKVIVSVIESKKAIKNDEFMHDGKSFTVVFKLWGEIPSSEGSWEGSKHNHEKVKKINKYLKENADSIFRKHSNMEMMRACLFRIKKDSAKKEKAISEPCIAIYCSFKGVVPVGEKEFPPEMDGIATDIREGFFHLHANYDVCANPNDHLDPLRMGASISIERDVKEKYGYGTLGGFVQLNTGEIGFITCAHVLHKAEEMLNNTSHTQEHVVQPPVGDEGSERCGQIFRSAFPSPTTVDGVSVDATVVKLTTRTPKEALFANLTTARLRTLGFSRSMLQKFCCGKIRSGKEALDCLNDRVLKCGMKTGLTLGKLEIGDTFARYRNVELFRGQHAPTMYMSQLTIRREGNNSFSDSGDSGSLVFQFRDVNHLHCIGMLVAGDGKYAYATPITSVLQALDVTLKEF